MKKTHQKNNKKKKDGGAYRKQYRIAALLFAVILAVFFGADIKSAVSALPFPESVRQAVEWLPERGRDTGGKGGQTVSDDLQVHFLDVGQGDATLIICGEDAMLIDAGGNSEGTRVQAYLESRHISGLTYLVGTHPDADHIGGLDVVLTKFDCDYIFMPEFEKETKTYEDVIAAAKYKNKKITHPRAGETYPLGDAEFTILGPLKPYASNANDASVCLRLEHGENVFLFTGDAEEKAEADMLAAGEDLKADVYKVAHHGSRTATTEPFFEAVSPEYAVISCGEDNSYGHPHAEVLNRLRAAGVKLFRTDEQGTIVVDSDGRNLTFNCSPSESWQAGN